MELSILYFKGLLVRISIKLCILVLKQRADCFITANSGDPDVMFPDLDEKPPYAAFHLGLHCLPKYQFTGIYD